VSIAMNIQVLWSRKQLKQLNHCQFMKDHNCQVGSTVMLLTCCRKVPGSNPRCTSTVINQVPCCFFTPPGKLQDGVLTLCWLMLIRITYKYSFFTSQITLCVSVRKTNRLMFGIETVDFVAKIIWNPNALRGENAQFLNVTARGIY
jgi:hypothetical protein